MNNSVMGQISDIQHFSVHDGPGIRCSIFLKGCNLRCRWCHNPENILARDHELSFVPSRCILCGYCFRVCPNNCHRIENNVHTLDWSSCVRCGRCAAECYAKALTVVGHSASAAEVLSEVVRDKIFYQTSGGGITLSGGEPMLQREFVQSVLQLAKQQGIHTALETCGVYRYQQLDGIKENVDLFLVDYKATDPKDHQRFTGSSNELVLENLKRLHLDGCKVLIRCPIIPGQNDTQEHFKRIAELTQEYPNFLGAELLPYHRLGVPKIDRFGLADAFLHGEFPTPSLETQQQWIEEVRGFGGRLVNED